MVALPRRRTSEAAVPLAVAVTIFAFACGTSSVERISEAAETPRWVVLGGLLAVALGYAWSRWDGVRALPPATAVAVLLVGLAALSTVWSVAPWLTFGRTVSLAVLLAAAGGLAYGAWGRPGEVERVLLGILAGAVAVALAGLVVLAVSPDTAVAGSTSDFLSRFRGFGLTPNTASMLYALSLPLAVLAVVRARTPAWRAAAAVAFVLLDVSLIASGSRGSQIAGLLGLTALACASSGRTRLYLALAIAASAAFAVGVGLEQTVDDTPPPAAAAPSAPPSAVNPGALDQELGHGLTGEGASRTLLGSSGRVEAWQGAIEQGNRRPLLGHGFGTEDRVFFDRYYAFQGGVPSNSWLGLYLQLGLAGVALFAAIWAALAAAAARVLVRAADPAAAASAAVVVAALPLTLVESWVYSVGNIATASFWISAFLLAAAVAARRSVPVDAPAAPGAPAREPRIASLARS